MVTDAFYGCLHYANPFHAYRLMNCMAARIRSEQEISASAPSTLPNAMVDKLVTPSMNGSDIEASVQPINVGKSTTEVKFLNC